MGIPAPATKRPWLRRARHAVVRALHGVMHLSDSPHRIAIGCAAGLFVMPLPLPGQMLLGPLLARLIGGNVVASLPWTWINNPFTFLFFTYGQYRLGLLMIPGRSEVLSFADLTAMVEAFNRLPWGEALNRGLVELGAIMLPLALGSLAAGIGFAGIGYFSIRRLVEAAQARKKARHAGWRDGSSDASGVGTGTGIVPGDGRGPAG